VTVRFRIRRTVALCDCPLGALVMSGEPSRRRKKRTSEGASDWVTAADSGKHACLGKGCLVQALCKLSVCARARVCVCVCVRTRVCACVRARLRVCVLLYKRWKRVCVTVCVVATRDLAVPVCVFAKQTRFLEYCVGNRV
jgi:hypothetical protein